jgi:hypothetical protein
MANHGKVVMGGVATLADICRLWSTLTTDYIPGLRIELIPRSQDRSSEFVVAELVDYSEVPEPGGTMRSVWSSREFYSPLYLISHTQLFDLLIVGYRNIEAFFAEGKDHRPSSM